MDEKKEGRKYYMFWNMRKEKHSIYQTPLDTYTFITHYSCNKKSEYIIYAE